MTGAVHVTLDRGRRNEDAKNQTEIRRRASSERIRPRPAPDRLGGGVVTDFTAFLASTYMRGVPSSSSDDLARYGRRRHRRQNGGRHSLRKKSDRNDLPSHPYLHRVLALLGSLPDPEWTMALLNILRNTGSSPTLKSGNS